MKSILQKAYGISPKTVTILPVEGGLINNTWKVTGPEGIFILQRINASVFRNPPLIADNCKGLSQYLSDNFPDYLFPAPLAGKDGRTLYPTELGYFRLFSYIKGSHTIATVESTDQAYEAARQFGRFTALFSQFDVDQLKPSIPDFHDLSLRYEQFELSIQTGDPDRIRQCIAEITEMRLNRTLVETFKELQHNPNVPLRVIHHDTKISNVLFDEHDQGLCVIDLDTVMPGYFISDFGDIVRTYVSPVNEEEKEAEGIIIRESFFRAIMQGYFEEMGLLLNEDEWKLVLYAGQFMIYMQALRFLTDYFRSDSYYGASYEGHNLFRARNQLYLLRMLKAKEPILQDIVDQEKNRILRKRS